MKTIETVLHEAGVVNGSDILNPMNWDVEIVRACVRDFEDPDVTARRQARADKGGIHAEKVARATALNEARKAWLAQQ